MKKLLLPILFVIFTFVSCEKKGTPMHAMEIKYTCPMHPQIVQDKPGTCPICGMDLVLINEFSKGDGTITLSDNQIKLGNITTMLTRREDISGAIITNGKVVVNEEQTKEIDSRIEGRIEKLYFKEAGQIIRKGEPLYQIYSEQLLTLQQEYLLALSQYEMLGEHQNGFQSFLKSSARKLLLFGMTENQLAQLAKHKTLESEITFMAPVSGVIAKIDAIEGEYVSEGSRLYSIENLDQLWIEAELYQNEISLAKIGDTVDVVVSGFERTTIKGRIIFLGPEYRKQSQVITLRVLIANSKGQFLPGMQANVTLLNTARSVIALPIDAVIRDESGSHVWIQKDGGFNSRMVKTGVENSDQVEIIDGLDENEHVVITGAYSLDGERLLKTGGDPIIEQSH